MSDTNKASRILQLFYRFNKGEHIDRVAFMREHSITLRSFNRDIEEIRVFLSNIFSNKELLFDHKENRYYFTERYPLGISREEVLAILKVLIGSRAVSRDCMTEMIHMVIGLLPRDMQNSFINSANKELARYSPLTNNRVLLRSLWELKRSIDKRCYLKIRYGPQTDGHETVAAPTALFYSENYFYLIGWERTGKGWGLASFRLDLIRSFSLMESVPEPIPAGLWEDSIRNSTSLTSHTLDDGPLRTVTVKCAKESLNLVLDRYPLARAVKKGREVTLEIEVFGDGVADWVLRCGGQVVLLEPRELREKVSEASDRVYMLHQRAE